jgi:hypothetical protein
MVYDGSREADIRGINIDKLAKGFGKLIPTFKRYAVQSKTSDREIRWYRKGLTLATAMNPLDTPTTTGVTGSLMNNTSFGSLPAVTEMKWERQTSYVKKYFVESPTLTDEDIKDSDIDILASNVEELVRAVHFKVDRRIYDVLTEATTSGTPNPTNVNTDAATAGWSTIATCNPILDMLIAKRKLIAAGYDPNGRITLMNQLEEQSLINYLITVKGSSIPDMANDKAKSGVIMSLLGSNIVVSPNATADWVITFVPNKAVKWKSFTPTTSAVMNDPGIGKKIRVWEEGEALLTDPLAVHVISSAS